MTFQYSNHFKIKKDLFLQMSYQFQKNKTSKKFLLVEVNFI